MMILIAVLFLVGIPAVLLLISTSIVRLFYGKLTEWYKRKHASTVIDDGKSVPDSNQEAAVNAAYEYWLEFFRPLS